MMFSKIQVIVILRENIPGLGLKEAKAMVDKYELKAFEDRVARVMGEEIRQELRSWAMIFVNSRDEAFNAVIPVKEYKLDDGDDDSINDYDEDDSFNDYDVDDDYDESCRCEDCVRYLCRDTIRKSSEIWSLDTGIQVLDPDGWDRMNYEDSWYEQITRDEFLRRAGTSTCKKWPEPLLDV